MDYAQDPSTPGCGEEGARVVDCLRVAEVRVIEAHPVGVVEDLGTFEGRRESLGVVEVEGMYLDSISEWLFAIGGVRKGTDAIAGSEQPLGDVAARVAKSTRYNVQVTHSMPSGLTE